MNFLDHDLDGLLVNAHLLAIAHAGPKRLYGNLDPASAYLLEELKPLLEEGAYQALKDYGFKDDAITGEGYPRLIVVSELPDILDSSTVEVGNVQIATKEVETGEYTEKNVYLKVVKIKYGR